MPRRVQADRHGGPRAEDQRGLPQAREADGPGDADPERHLARGRPRPGGASFADRLSADCRRWSIPSYGSVVAKTRENERGALPPYVAVPDAPIFSSSGYLTPAYDPFAVGGDPNQAGFRVRDLTPPDRLTLDRLRRRRGMVKSLDEFAHDVAADAAEPQPRPVRRPGVRPAHLERGAGGVQDRRRARTSSATGTAGPAGPGLPAGPPADRGGRRRSSRSTTAAWARSAGTRTSRTSRTIKNTLAPPLDQGVSALLADLAGARAAATAR